MKVTTVLLLLLIVQMTSSCSIKRSGESIANSLQEMAAALRDMNRKELDDSQDDWNEVNSNEETYTYRTSTKREDIEKTVLTVDSSGRILERSFIRMDEDENIISQWKENEETLGVHDEGSSLKSIDDFYEECNTLLKTLDDHQNLCLDFNSDNIIQVCYVKNIESDSCEEMKLYEEITFK